MARAACVVDQDSDLTLACIVCVPDGVDEFRILQAAEIAGLLEHSFLGLTQLPAHSSRGLGF
jgi:hypothetical protein